MDRGAFENMTNTAIPNNKESSENLNNNIHISNDNDDDDNDKNNKTE